MGVDIGRRSVAMAVTIIDWLVSGPFLSYIVDITMRAVEIFIALPAHDHLVSMQMYHGPHGLARVNCLHDWDRVDGRGCQRLPGRRRLRPQRLDVGDRRYLADGACRWRLRSPHGRF